MESTVEELNALFAPSSGDGLPPDVLGELRSMLRLHSISAQELFYKWESYSMKMGDDTKLKLDTARAFKKDVQDALERENKGKSHIRGSDKRNGVGATPRAVAGGGDVFGMLDELVPNTPYSRSSTVVNGSSKRKSTFETPSVTKISRSGPNSSPGDFKTPSKPSNGVARSTKTTSFVDRQNSGQIVESLNNHLSIPDPPIAPYSEPRIRLTANTDLKKFSYKPMAMRLAEASEVLDDRIDEFAQLIQDHHKLEDNAFGNPTSQKTSEIIAVGRIASDSLEGKLNSASLVLETSRRMGAGRRVPLRVDSLPGYQFFPGQIVAFRGTNPNGEYFSVSEMLTAPILPPAASTPATLESINERLGGSDTEQALNLLLGSGPYTADDNLDFEPFEALCDKAANDSVDALILTGPFLDVEHPLLASGDLELPEMKGINPDEATLITLFHVKISQPLQRLVAAVPSITILLVSSVRDIVNRHVSWPQDKLVKSELRLPKQARLVPNPVFLSLNETVVGISSHDILYELRHEEVAGGKVTEPNLLARLPRHLLEQRHFSPLFPPVSRKDLPKNVNGGVAMGAMLDISYLKLGEWWNVRPDVLITPSLLPPFVKVVESVLVVNPGTLSKRKGAGTFAQMAIHPRVLTDEEREHKDLGHKLFERARVDVVRI